MKMAVSGQERRQEIRYSLCGEVPARMTNLATQEELTFLAIDISQRGLGLLASSNPTQGQVVRLDFTGKDPQSLEFIIRHVHLIMENPLPGFEGMRRCGLELKDDGASKLDLIDFFGSFDSVMIGD